jgi:acetyltransferase-like isoleucine patch superfamily enzyme
MSLRRGLLLGSSLISFAIFVAVYEVLGPSRAVHRLWHMRSSGVLHALRFGGAKIGVGTVIEGPLFLNIDSELGFRPLTIGCDCYLGESVHIDIKGPVSIGDRVTISMGTHLLSHQDVGRSRLRASMPEIRPGCRIGSDSYLGAGAIVLPGSSIGSSCVIGAGAVVVGEILSQQTAAGVPARPLVNRSQ